MRTGEAISDLRRMGGEIVTTREAATRWQVDQRVAGQRLYAGERDGLVLNLRRGLWSLSPDIDPMTVPPFLTSPNPAYVSFWSALHHHHMIEQIPRSVLVATLGRPRRIQTSVGAFELHRLAPEVFGGFEGSEEDGYIAKPEKALFDAVYVRAAARKRAHFPELEPPQGFNPAEINVWIHRIRDRSLRTLVSKRIEDVLEAMGTAHRFDMVR